MAKIRPSGGYRELRSFQIATVIYDATYWFCERFLEPRTRMSDQMVQAARSGRQNIAEGSRASATSSQTELRLVNVARSSLEELLLDYEDYLRHRRLPQWAPESPEALAVRRVGKNDGRIRPIGPMVRNTLNTPDGSTNRTPPCAPTRSSASSTRPITCSTGRSRRWKRRLSLRAATANSLPPHRGAGPQEKAGVGQSDGSGRSSSRSPHARSAANPWRCAPRKKGKTPASSSGAAPDTPNARRLQRSDRMLDADHGAGARIVGREKSYRKGREAYF